MPSYLESAINELYSEGDYFIVLGLTGRTGSGCSTVASILTSEKGKIKHSLYSGNTPSNNEERKQRIILKHFSNKWEKFTLLQIRSLITLLIAQSEIPKDIEKIKIDHGIDEDNYNRLQKKSFRYKK